MHVAVRLVFFARLRLGQRVRREAPVQGLCFGAFEVHPDDVDGGVWEHVDVVGAGQVVEDGEWLVVDEVLFVARFGRVVEAPEERGAGLLPVHGEPQPLEVHEHL